MAGKKAFRNICVPCSCLIGVLGDWAQKPFPLSAPVPVPALLPVAVLPISCCGGHNAPSTAAEGSGSLCCISLSLTAGRMRSSAEKQSCAFFNHRKEGHSFLTAVEEQVLSGPRSPACVIPAPYKLTKAFDQFSGSMFGMRDFEQHEVWSGSYCPSSSSGSWKMLEASAQTLTFLLPWKTWEQGKQMAYECVWPIVITELDLLWR